MQSGGPRRLAAAGLSPVSGPALRPTRSLLQCLSMPTLVDTTHTRDPSPAYARATTGAVRSSCAALDPPRARHRRPRKYSHVEYVCTRGCPPAAVCSVADTPTCVRACVCARQLHPSPKATRTRGTSREGEETWIEAPAASRFLGSLACALGQLVRPARQTLVVLLTRDGLDGIEHTESTRNPARKEPGRGAKAKWGTETGTGRGRGWIF